jgi:hypothetical protein
MTTNSRIVALCLLIIVVSLSAASCGAPITGVKGKLQYEKLDGIVVDLILPPESVGGKYLVQLSVMQTSPESSGAFLFKDVKPGKYSLSFHHKSNPSLKFLPLMDKQGIVTFEVKADQTVDLGTIPVEFQ